MNYIFRSLSLTECFHIFGTAVPLERVHGESAGIGALAVAAGNYAKKRGLGGATGSGGSKKQKVEVKLNADYTGELPDGSGYLGLLMRVDGACARLNGYDGKDVIIGPFDSRRTAARTRDQCLRVKAQVVGKPFGGVYAVVGRGEGEL